MHKWRLSLTVLQDDQMCLSNVPERQPGNLFPNILKSYYIRKPKVLNKRMDCTLKLFAYNNYQTYKMRLLNCLNERFVADCVRVKFLFYYWTVNFKFQCTVLLWLSLSYTRGLDYMRLACPYVMLADQQNESTFWRSQSFSVDCISIVASYYQVMCVTDWRTKKQMGYMCSITVTACHMAYNILR